MDCSVMQAEAILNPDLFLHHLHIDLTKPVPTSVDTMAPGSIFCNNDIVPTATSGACYFMCIDGFSNDNSLSYDGCEIEKAPPNEYRFIIPGVPDIPAVYGGYMMGDYHVEYYMAWLNTIGRSLPITLPTNLQLFNYQLSALYLPPVAWPTLAPTDAGVQPILWY